MEETERQAKLVCTSGTRLGTEFNLDSSRVIIGRAADAAIGIADSSVSRRHLLLQRDPSGWLASDMGSGNGTLVNGKPLTGERCLRHADVLTLGETELTFVDPPGRGRGPLAGLKIGNRRARVRMGAAVGACALLGILGLALKTRMTAAEDAAARLASEARTAQAELSTVFQVGKNLVREGKWDQAMESFERVHRDAPDFPGVEAYLDRSKVEIPNQKFLAAAREALARNELGAAAEALAQVSVDTQQHQQLAALKVALGERLALRLAEARTALSTRAHESALQMAEDLLRAFPDNSDARALAERAQQEIAAGAKPASAGQGTKVWGPAVSRYRDGDLKKAIGLVNHCALAGVSHCQSLLKNMKEISELSREVDELDLKRLEKLLALDRQIGGGRPTQTARTAMARAADIYYKAASAAKAAGQWTRAMDLASKSLEIKPGHPGATALLAEIGARSREQFLIAYSMKDTAPEEALHRLREVAAMTPPGDEIHLKATSWIEKLSR